MKRFNHDADTFEEAENYMRNRAVQLLRKNIFLIDILEYREGIIGRFVHDGQLYQSIFIYHSFRGKGYYEKLMNLSPDLMILTSNECGITDYLKSKGIKYKWTNLYTGSEYQQMQALYGDGKAERSGTYFMNHIDEGLAILEWIGANSYAKDAYCIHPIFQEDENFKNYMTFNVNQKKQSIYDSELSYDVLVNVMEYRWVANNFLSTHLNTVDKPKLSVLKDVNDMLIADKIQNRKDFEIYHQKHNNASGLITYFNLWLKELGITEETYYEIKHKLIIVAPNVKINF